MAQSAKNFEFWLFVQIFCTPLMCREFCTPPIRGDRNSVPLPFEVSGILYPSLRILYPLGPLNNERPLNQDIPHIRLSTPVVKVAAMIYLGRSDSLIISGVWEPRLAPLCLLNIDQDMLFTCNLF